MRRLRAVPNLRVMAITFFPKAGTVLVCDFRGNEPPEIVSIRPVVVISPNHLRRPGLCTVVPLSTTAPDPIRPYHCRIDVDPLGGRTTVIWAKCDLVTTVSLRRLDRVRVGPGRYRTGSIPPETLRHIRIAAARSFGVEPGAKQT